MVVALNGLQGFNMTDAKINLTAAAGEPNLSGLAYIPNPSDLTIALVCSQALRNPFLS
jgi:hypothetical protein